LLNGELMAKSSLLCAIGFLPFFVACGGTASVTTGDTTDVHPTDGKHLVTVTATRSDGSAFRGYATVYAKASPDGTRQAPTLGCSCEHGIGSPAGNTLSAGAITFTSSSGAPLTTLLPHDSGAGYSNYADTQSDPWNPGDVLAVSAKGADAQPFTGKLRTAEAFTGVSPALGTTPTTIDRSKDLKVAWTPGDHPDDVVSFGVSQVSTSAYAFCGCTAKDGDGTLTMSTTYLAQLGAGTGAELSMARSTATNGAGDDPSIQLVGQESISGSATLK
jgi:hypothetical protein